MNTTTRALIGVGLLVGIGMVVGGLSAAPAATEKKPVYGDSKPLGPYTPGIDVGDTVYLAGQIGVDSSTGNMVDGGIEAETQQVMKNLGGILKAAGLDYADVVKSTVYLADMDDFQAMNGVYATFFEGTTPPARSTVEAGIALGAAVEIDFIAVR